MFACFSVVVVVVVIVLFSANIIIGFDSLLFKFWLQGVLPRVFSVFLFNIGFFRPPDLNPHLRINQVSICDNKNKPFLLGKIAFPPQT